MKIFLLYLLLLLPLTILSAQEEEFSTLTDKQILRLIDDAIEAKDKDFVSLLGQIDLNHPNYGKFESYILDKASELINSDDLSYPLLMVEAVLYNNLENSVAQELYTVIVTKKIEIDERVVLEEKRNVIKREELESLAEEIDEDIIKEEKMASIVGLNKELIKTKKSYTDSFDKTHFVSNSFIYPFSFNYYKSEVYDEFTGREPFFNYLNGQGVELGIGISFKYITLRMDLSGNIVYLDLIHEIEKHFLGFGTLSLGFPKAPIPLFFRAGFLYDLYQFDESELSIVAITNLPSPTLGLSLTGVKLFKVLKLDLSLDYLYASTYTENLDYGFLNKTYLTLNLIRIGSNHLELRGGIDILFLSEGGLSEVNYNPRFGFGVSSYE